MFYGPFRRKADRMHLTVELCHSCHNEPPDGVHHNRERDLRLKREFQQRVMEEQGWDTDRFIREFGRNYL